jgi:N-acetylmuramoyl-L-alanine amidase
MTRITTVILKGDYGTDSSHERQAMARREGCVATVDLHFNSSGASSARGGEVFYKPGDAQSRTFAQHMWTELARLGLPPRRAPMREASDRGGYIRYYTAPAILIEPLFLSNRAQATWLHTPANLEALSLAVSTAVRRFVHEGHVGLSPGHAYKTRSPRDPGARCAKGDWERDHVLALTARVEALLATATG